MNARTLRSLPLYVASLVGLAGAGCTQVVSDPAPVPTETSNETAGNAERGEAFASSRALGASLKVGRVRAFAFKTTVLMPAETNVRANVSPSAATWSGSGNLTEARSGHRTVVLANGNALVIGGAGDAGILSGAELYDPQTGTASTTGSMANARYSHTANVLANGEVLVTGGWDSGDATLTLSEIYDPATGEWRSTGSLSEARAEHEAVVLNDGRVLVVGGAHFGVSLASAEIYDLATGTWTTTGALSGSRGYFTATKLQDGRVLVAGGWVPG